MTKIGVSLCNQNYRRPFPGRSIIVEKDIGKECYNPLVSREERAALIKAGLTGKEIESEYLRRNRIIVVGIDWQD